MVKKSEQIKKINQLKNRIQKILGKSTKVIKSILCVIMVILSLNTILTTNSVKAENISGFELYSKQNLYCFKYRGYLYRSEFVVYNFEGKEYPAYCLNRELNGVSLQHGGYKVDIKNLITDELVWKAIINGYPYKTYQELGCNNEMEAFTATKLAVYDMMYNYNLEDFVPVNDAGERVIAAIKNISYIARNSTQTKVAPQIQIQSLNQKWEVDETEKQYISKKFKVNSNSELSNYIVQAENIKGAQITNLENCKQNVFKNSEEFKILIPIDQLNKEQKIEISATANLKTYPIYYGKAPENLQNYAISGLEYETANNIIQEEIPKNKTSIIIEKMDADTKEKLENFEFLITNDNNQQNKTVITNEQGIIELTNLIPGQYTIKEIKGSDEYIIKDEEIKINVEYNQNYNVVVENFKKPIEEPIKLPKTGF